MSMVTYPLNNIEYTAEDAELFHVTRTSGVYAKNSFDYSVNGSDNNIIIGTGIGWIKNSEFSGKVVAQKEFVSLDVGLPDSVYPRIDAVVIQFNANKNATEILVKKGIASSYPVAPEVVRTESIYELHLYHIKRDAGELSISASNITDLRSNDAYCGLMSDSVTRIIDTTLSISGVAADAKATGDALKQRAPAGYGWGETKTIYNPPYGDPDNVDRTCVFSCSQGNIPAGGVWRGVAIFQNADNGQMVIRSYTNSVDAVARRCKRDGVWQPWEWVTPWLTPGVEYRTTELWNGKAVYTKVIECGNLPNNTRKQIAIGTSVSKALRCIGTRNDGEMIPMYYDGKEVVLYASKDNIHITTNFDSSATTANVQVWYTKD